MNRREFVKSAVAVGVIAALPTISIVSKFGANPSVPTGEWKTSGAGIGQIRGHKIGIHYDA